MSGTDSKNAFDATSSRTKSSKAQAYEANLVVARRTEEAAGVVILELRNPTGGPLPVWEPGAHIELVLDDGRTRQYSLCGDPADGGAWEIAVLRESGGRGGSAYVYDGLTQGTAVRVRGPRNHFPLLPAPRYVFIAGGIGITPLLPMIAAAQAAGAQWTLLYGGRTRDSMAFTRRLAEHGDRVHITPQDESGLLDLASVLAVPEPGTLVYCCGPEPLLAAVEEQCRAWPPDALHIERFSAKARAAANAGQDPGSAPAEPGSITSGSAEAGPVNAASANSASQDPTPLDTTPLDSTPFDSTPFELVLRQSGLTLTVPPGLSILQAVRDAGVSVLYSCTEGTCGTCETDIIEGEADHRDAVLTPQEQASNESMMICVSRCRGTRLVLDL